MYSGARWVVTLGALMGFLVLGVGATAGVPEWIAAEQTSDREKASWVSADRATAGDSVDWSLFTESEATMLRGYLRDAQAREDRLRRIGKAETNAEAPCTLWLGAQIIDWEGARPQASLSDLSSHAKAIYAGQISDVREGFYLGEPGSLVEVSVDRAWKAPLPAEILVFYPHAVIPLEGGAICKRGPRYPATPQPGGRLLVFSYRTVAEESGTVVYPEDDTLFFASPTGSDLSVPIRFASQVRSGLELSDIEAQVEQILETSAPLREQR